MIRLGEPATYNLAEVAVILNVSETSIREAARRGEIPTIRVGRRWLVSRAALAAMLAAPPDSYASRPDDR